MTIMFIQFTIIFEHHYYRFNKEHKMIEEIRISSDHLLCLMTKSHTQLHIFLIKNCDEKPSGVSLHGLSPDRGDFGDRPFHIWEEAIFPTSVWSKFYYSFKFKIEGR